MQARLFPKNNTNFSAVMLCLLLAMYATPSCILIGWALLHRSARIVAVILVTSLIAAATAAAITRRWRLFFLCQFPFYFAGMVFVVYTVSYGMPPGQTLANLLIGASLEEARGFAMLPQGRALTLLLLTVSAGYLGLASLIRSDPIFRRARTGRRRAYLAFVTLLMAVAISDPSELIDGVALQPLVGSVMFLSGDLPRASRLLSAEGMHKIPYGAKRIGAEEVHILVVGEAARRDSWSAYGYSRATTSQLDALGQSVIWFRSATADANLTQWAVPILLTGIAPDKIGAAQFSGNLFDLAKEATYRTGWLVNQDISSSTQVGVKPDVLEFPPDFDYTINGRHTLDETLLPALRRLLSERGSSRFIGIHMMGSHWEYYNRYPARFRRYGDADSLKKLSMLSVFVSGNGNDAAVVDSYDNSVLYTDWFLRQVIDSANELAVPVTVTYFPDHGEDLQYLDGSAGHGAPIFTSHAFSIPAFVWFNSLYRTAHPDVVASVKTNASARIRSYDLFCSLGQIMGISWPRFDPHRSFASKDFLPDKTTGIIAGGIVIPSPRSFPDL